MEQAEAFLKIQDKFIGESQPTYFIADIAANHDGDIERAKALIYQAAEAGADAAKFQHFKAETIVSDIGFKALGQKKSHQSSWKKSVFEVYKDASINISWTQQLKETCDKAGIAFFTSPYSFDLIDHVDPYIPAYKIGSGDITWLEIIEYIASKNKPYILATGASNINEVLKAVKSGLQINKKLALLQCNTNYTGSLENFKYINLRVLNTYRVMFPGIVLGLSDHTPGHSTVLGAVALGARIIEKHFTDDNSRSGPDHAFSMNQTTWTEMVSRTRELENALGSTIKNIEKNELETSVVQRRSIRVSRDLQKGNVLKREDLEVLRPCPEDGISPMDMKKILGKQLTRDIDQGDYLKWIDLSY